MELDTKALQMSAAAGLTSGIISMGIYLSMSMKPDEEEAAPQATKKVTPPDEAEAQAAAEKADEADIDKVKKMFMVE